MRQPQLPTELLAAPFRSADGFAAGLTREQLRARCWRRVLHDVYIWQAIPDTLASRVAALRLVLPAGGAVSGRTAAWLYGADVRRSADEPIEITVPRSCVPPRRPGICARQALLPDADLVDVGGLPATSPVRTAFDLVRRPNLLEGVVGLDALLHAELVATDGVAAYVDEHPRWRGVRTAARALTLADGRAESPMETRLRLVIVLPGLPPPDLQVELRDAGGEVVARIDLAHAAVRRGYEYDGRHHASQLAADHERRNRVWAEFGYELRLYTARDVFRRPQRIVAQVALGLGLPVPVVPAILHKWLSS